MEYADSILATIERAYEEKLDSLDWVANTIIGSPDVLVSKYDYRTDERGRRTDVVYTGEAFTDDHLFKWSYNERNELTGAQRYEGTNPESPGDPMTPGEYVYAYDGIGNRQTHEVDEDEVLYAANEVNQYLATTNPGRTLLYDGDGNLAASSAAGADGPMLVRAWSVRTHGSAGDFAIPLPLVQPGSAGVECRVGGLAVWAGFPWTGVLGGRTRPSLRMTTNCVGDHPSEQAPIGPAGGVRLEVTWTRLGSWRLAHTSGGSGG